MRTASYVALVTWLSIEWLASCAQTVNSDDAAAATDKREFYRIGRNFDVDSGADRYKRQFYRIGRDFQPSLDDVPLAAKEKREFYRIGRGYNGWKFDDEVADRLKREFYRIGRDYQSSVDDDSLAAKEKRQFYRIGRDYNFDDQAAERFKRQFYRIGRAYQPYQDKRFLRFGRSAHPTIDDIILQPDEELYRKRRSVAKDDHSTDNPGRSKRSDEEKDQSVSGAADEGSNKDVEKREADTADLADAKRFMRFGRGDPEAMKKFMRFGKRFMRFGRNLSDDKRFMRFGKRFMRLGRLPEIDKSYVRFGKRSGGDWESDQTLSDGFDDAADDVELNKKFMRFGKRFMRFGKREAEAEKRFMRFGRSGTDKRFMRFGKRALADEANEKRFMRFGRDSQDKRFFRFGKRETRSVDSQSQKDLIQS